ncbi:phage holin family protein [Clostridium akagii]|uniref:phage holin family protein n=1 Tax=Clostridium akagii TaxID=91623 RepID=UPI00047DF15B|nr:phage holin family protein [Clostridium akagii]
MAHNKDFEKSKNTHDKGGLHWIWRLVYVAIILSITSYVTPGFTINGLWGFLLAAAIIIVLDYLVELIMGVDASPFGRGISGFLVTVVIIYATQFLVPYMRVSIIGAILAALVVGILDAIIPGRAV